MNTTKPNTTKKKRNTSLFKRINHWLHLWLGLSSGIIVCIISITGALYVFHKEIKDYIEDWRFVEVQDKNFVPPSALIDTAQKAFPNKKPTGLTYGAQNEAAAVGFESMKNGRPEFSVVFMNPYDATILKKQTIGEKFDFFDFILKGHRYLWLPYDIGKLVIGSAVLVFLVLMISGLIMWWPKKWKKIHREQSFKVKWKASPKRRNYDLHKVLGFYVMSIAIVFAITGLVWSFEWFAKGFYFVTSGGVVKEVHEHPHSDISQKEVFKIEPQKNIDKAWLQVMQHIKTIKGGMYIAPEIHEDDDPIEIVVFNQHGKFYDRDEYFFDQYSLQPLRQKGDRYEDAGFADTLYAMNYDLHTGAILGLPTKVLAFFISLICASLPITGFLIWWNRRNKGSSKPS